ncbi:DUF6305 family protein [Pyramidobacter sp. CG50-2]|uniref:DUF6305 family protein n=1 Tax=Pyramidobacter sp. CG50-2 TaxID=2382160 RepID=UPI000EA10487|nr:DUF6305 family protein [Pyramidobacter sp. CG50-2]RKJ79480.1 hypothetical protein D7D26_04855 [Pyramidobacter sp. CG50-2]
MKNFSCLAILIWAVFARGGTPAAELPSLPRVEAPVLITGFGQSQDANLVNILSRRLKIDYEYKLDVPAQDVDWGKYRTVFAVLGCSSSVYCCSFDADSTAIVITRDGRPSPTVSGLSILDESARCSEILAGAKKHGVKVIAMHIGGEPRRLKNSEPFLPFAGDADFVIVRADGNQDGYFTALCAEKNVPLCTIEKTADLKQLIPAMLRP